MEHFVALERLPDGIEFPADMGDRIGYDPVTRRLWFRGYMSKSEFDRIGQLTRDWSFRRKLEELFQLSIEDDQGEPKRLHGWLSLFRKRVVPS